MESVGGQGLKPGEGGWKVMSPLRLENGRKGQEERESLRLPSTTRTNETAEQLRKRRLGGLWKGICWHTTGTWRLGQRGQDNADKEGKLETRAS